MQERFETFTVLINRISRDIRRIKNQEMAVYHLRSAHVSCLYYIYSLDGGFIDHRANDFKCAGLWKVYGDEKKARSLFEKYRKCTEIYCALWQSGLKLEQLAVAV